MTPTRGQLDELLRLVLYTRPEELDCDGFLERVGTLLERLGHGGDALPAPPDLAAVSQHLAVCAECHEEFEALVAVYDARRPNAGDSRNVGDRTKSNESEP